MEGTAEVSFILAVTGPHTHTREMTESTSLLLFTETEEWWKGYK